MGSAHCNEEQSLRCSIDRQLSQSVVSMWRALARVTFLHPKGCSQAIIELNVVSNMQQWQQQPWRHNTAGAAHYQQQCHHKEDNGAGNAQRSMRQVG